METFAHQWASMATLCVFFLGVEGVGGGASLTLGFRKAHLLRCVDKQQNKQY